MKRGVGDRAGDSGNQKKIQQELAEFSEDARYLEAHRDELLQMYENRWIAIYRGEVVAADADFENVLAALAERGIVGRAVVEYLTRHEPSYLRPS